MQNKQKTALLLSSMLVIYIYLNTSLRNVDIWPSRTGLNIRKQHDKINFISLHTPKNVKDVEQLSRLLLVRQSLVHILKEVHAGLDTLAPRGSEAADDVLRLLEELRIQFWYVQEKLGLVLEDGRPGEGPGWREMEATQLTKIVQDRFHHLQNPTDCGKAKKVMCKIARNCGSTCSMHHAVYCMTASHALGRTLVLQQQGWMMSKDGLNDFFHPVTNTCPISHHDMNDSIPWNEGTDKTRVLLFPMWDNINPWPNYMAPAIPADLAPRLTRVYPDPSIWWIGQMFQFMLRPLPTFHQFIEEHKHRIGYEHPIVSIHVRRTDKLNSEAIFLDLDLYMQPALAFFEEQALRGRPVHQRRVFIATDDNSVIQEAKKKYPDIEFAHSSQSTEAAGKFGQQRFKMQENLKFTLVDVLLLSQADYLVCGMSSNVCRLASELKYAADVNAYKNIWSMDVPYHNMPGGSSVYSLRRNHTAMRDIEYPMRARETFRVHFMHMRRTRNFHDGYWFANRDNRQVAVPVYNAEQILKVAHMGNRSISNPKYK